MVVETTVALHAIATSSIFVLCYNGLPIVAVKWLVRKSPKWLALSFSVFFIPLFCAVTGIFLSAFYVGALVVPHDPEKLLAQFGIGGWMLALAVTSFIGIREVRRRRRNEG